MKSICTDLSRIRNGSLAIIMALVILVSGCASMNLFQSVKNGDLEASRRLLNDGNLNARALTINNRPTALHLAANNGRKEIARMLLDKKADVDPRNDLDWTPLMYSALRGYYDISVMLVEAGADVNSRDKNNGFTPLYIAADNNRPKTTQLLIDNGAEVNYAGVVGGFTALMTASQGGYLDIIEILVDSGADVKLTSKAGQSPLALAIPKSSKAAAFLIEKGARVDSRDDYGITPLMIAADYGRQEVVDLLLRKGADLNAKDKAGRTAVFFASLSGQHGLAEKLFELGAEFEPVEDKPINVYGTALSYWTNADFFNQKGEGDQALEYYRSSRGYFEKSLPQLKTHALKVTAKIGAAQGIGKYSDQHPGIVAMNKEWQQHEQMAKIAGEYVNKCDLEIKKLTAGQ